MKQTLKYILERLMEDRKFAEEKHSITIALSSAIIIFFSGYIKATNQLIQLLATLSLIFALISVLYSFFALTAKQFRTKTKNSIDDGNLCYFKDIARFDEDKYLLAMRKNYDFPKSYKVDEQDRDLAKQVIAISKAISIKLIYFNLALLFLAIGIVCGVVVVCLIGLL